MPDTRPASVPSQPDLNARADIESAISRGAERYFNACRAAVPRFVDRHFRYPGAFRTNRTALGGDMLRAPINLLWAPVYGLVCLLRALIRGRRSLIGLDAILGRVPDGLNTRVQRYISERILEELLDPGPSKRLEDYLVESLRDTWDSHHAGQVDVGRFRRLIEPLMEDALSQYRVTRTASADITNSLSCTVLGAFTFQKFTPGGIGIAIVLASIIAKALAVRDFFLGETLGDVYYSLFPPEPSTATTAVVIAAVLGLLSAVAALSGMVTDPIQAATGLHRRRLTTLIDRLQQDFLNQTRGSFRPKDAVVARILDAFDAIKSGLT